MSSLPNAITIARIGLVPLFVVALLLPGDSGRWGAFVLFCLASVTDAVDGIVARKWNAESSFGRMLDPIADKLIVSTALLMLAATVQDLQSWRYLVPALIILCREILVSGLREFLASAQVGVPVTRIAKLKTVMQMAAIAALIASSATESMLPGVTRAAIFGLWLAAALTLYTGYAYWRAGLAHMREGKGALSNAPAPTGNARPRKERQPA